MGVLLSVPCFVVSHLTKPIKTHKDLFTGDGRAAQCALLCRQNLSKPVKTYKDLLTCHGRAAQCALLCRQPLNKTH